METVEDLFILNRFMFDKYITQRSIRNLHHNIDNRIDSIRLSIIDSIRLSIRSVTICKNIERVRVDIESMSTRIDIKLYQFELAMS